MQHSSPKALVSALTMCSVLDLPQLHQKPSTKNLLDTLSLLTLEPSSWDITPALTTAASTPRSISGANTPAKRPKVRSEGVPQYLTRIISSPLAWISDDEEKEQVWDAASSRLSERSGRTGMGAITRNFRIPNAAEATNASSTMQPVITPSQDQDTGLNISIHEPALTEDNLGFKTWASSYVLAKKWHTLRDSLPLPQNNDNRVNTILELGAGTGLVGMAAAAVLKANVLLTDLPDIVPNLDRNIDSNKDTITSRGGSAKAAILDWTVPEKIIYPPQSEEEVNTRRRSLEAETESSLYPLIVAADPVYSEDQPAWLVQTIACHLSSAEDARVVLMIPLRDTFAKERTDLKERMDTLGLEVCEEDTEIGYDDWSEGRGEELAEVQCWMTIWRWKRG